MMTDSEIIYVVSAHKEGKKIECRCLTEDACWGTWSSKTWNFAAYEYRVAPEPRELLEWDAWYLPESKGLTDAWMERYQHAGWRPIKVREVAASREPAVISSSVKTSPETSPRKPREWTLAIERSTGHVYRAIENQPINQNFEDELVHVIEVIE